ncbi:HNH endonuclease [Rhodovarius lipocyclicus]|uniref:HNH endonuclease n=1 Tax=Rhodovarius lipocyclicus TaxID=268410 RepID=UPI0013592794|nr:HNH endonuclease [Rhodovarius lipocyclicus]
MADDKLRGRVCAVDGCLSPVARRNWCGAHYQRYWKHGDPEYVARPLNLSGCKVQGCGRQSRSPTAAFCEMHYYRIRRRGDVNPLPARPAKPTRHHTHGYVVEHRPGHAMTTPGSPRYAYQHRRVFFDAHGEGPFSCHVCGKDVDYSSMHVDHLDDDRSNNRLSNLAAACPTCNQWRGHDKVVAALRAKPGVLVEFQGERLSRAQWAARIGISRNALAARLLSGWSLERALTEGRGKTGPKARRRDGLPPA